MYETRDSTLWIDPDQYKAINHTDSAIRIGIVRSTYVDKDSIIRYAVEVNHNNSAVIVLCVHATRFNGVYNYEEFNLRPYLMNEGKSAADTPPALMSYSVRAGDVVLVAYINGDSREGVILGSIPHGARKSLVDNTSIVYRSMFNGIETQISKDGTYKITYHGEPKNKDKLDEPPKSGSSTPPKPEFNDKVDGSFFGFDRTGSFTVSDGKGQAVIIKKDKKYIVIKSGETRIEIGISEISGNKGLAIKADDISTTGKTFNVTADKINTKSRSVSLKADKVAIGSGSTELLAKLFDLIEALGTVITMSPVGPCNPLNATPQWPQIIQIQQAIKGITGTLSDTKQIGSAEDEDLFQDM